jgi:hypothetical protein
MSSQQLSSSNGASGKDSGMELSDKSNGYEEVAKLFMSERDSLTGVST